MTSLGERVKDLRTQAGLSQSQLAGEGVSPSYISLLEAGRRMPTHEVLHYLAGRLNTTPEYLSSGQRAPDLESVRLELDFAKIALGNGDWKQSLERLSKIDATVLDNELQTELGLTLARVYEALGDLESAVAILNPLIMHLTETRAHSLLLRAATMAAGCYLEAADLAHAVDVAEAALAAVAGAGLAGTDEHSRLVATLAWALYERGDLLYAQQLLASALSVVETDGSRRARGSLYWNAALVTEGQGNIAEARRLADRAAALLSEDDGGERDIARLHLYHGCLLLRGSDARPHEALRRLSVARAQLEQAGSVIDVAYCEVESARALTRLDRHDEARAAIESALRRLGDQPRLETAQAFMVLGDIEERLGRTESADALHRRAADTLGMIRSSRQSATAWRELGDRLRSRGDLEGALSAYDEALSQGGMPPTSLLSHHGTSVVEGADA